MSRRTLARAALALAVLGLSAAGFFTCFEQREVEVATGVSAQARSDRYLALARLLERMGHTVVALRDPAHLGELPEPPATLILPTSRSSIGPRRSRALLDWVARGGHLVVTGDSLDTGPDDDPKAGAEPQKEHRASLEPVRRSSGRPDPILDRFGLRRVAGKPPPHGDKEHRPEYKPPRFEDVLAGRFPERVSEASEAVFSDLETPLEVGFSPDYRWLDPYRAAVWSVAGPSGVHLVELPHERGRISALTSDEPLANDSIGERDNAEFVVRWLRRDAAAPGPIWILYDEKWPGLFALIARHAQPAAIAGAVLLFAWVWSALFRFGPALPEPRPVRRSWLEHLDAAAHFHWRADRGRALLEGLREEVVHHMRERHPGWRKLPDRERAERLAERIDLSPDEIEQALAASPSGARSFVATVSALERIRAAL